MKTPKSNTDFKVQLGDLSGRGECESAWHGVGAFTVLFPLPCQVPIVYCLQESPKDNIRAKLFPWILRIPRVLKVHTGLEIQISSRLIGAPLSLCFASSVISLIQQFHLASIFLVLLTVRRGQKRLIEAG